jgi:hypothetical protein
VTIGGTTLSYDEFPHDDLFPNIDDLFGNLNMCDNTDAAAAAATKTVAPAAANAKPYVLMSVLFQIFIEFLVLLFGVDAIGLSCVDAICSSTL